jgi:hypothetical protein
MQSCQEILEGFSVPLLRGWEPRLRTYLGDPLSLYPSYGFRSAQPYGFHYVQSPPRGEGKIGILSPRVSC